MNRLDAAKLPRHVAIIPDGNGRWAEARGLPRNEGHRRGCDVVREIVRASHELRLPMLTIYAFSQENWGRPPEEVDALMILLEHYLHDEADELARNGVRVQAIGSIEALTPGVARALDELVRRTEANDEMRVTFALSYGARSEIVEATRRIAMSVEAGRLEVEAIDEKALASQLYAPDLPDPDLLIRSGGEHRVSNFLLWQLAYTELYFSATLWPDFTKAELVEAILWYQQRERRIGKTGAQVRGES
jgi:undecaprenyl diphosphate synthase